MTETERIQIEGRPLVLYDGVCVLCNGVVRFLLRQDKATGHAQPANFRFAPLESPLGREILTQPPPQEGVVLITNALTPAERTYHRSDAIAEALRLLGGPWRPLGQALALIPRPLREFGYTLVARLRYRLFGRYRTCPLPTPGQRGKILGMDD